MKEQIIRPFREFTGTLKDIAWWIGGALAFAALAQPHLGALWFNVCAHCVAALFLIYSVIRALVYRRRNRRLYQASKHIHNVVHKLRDKMCRELQLFEQFSDATQVSQEAVTDAMIESLHETLQDIVTSAAYCFSDLTGYPCAAVLVMPEKSEADGNHFKSRIYSNNASEERKKDSRPHRTGLISRAFKEADIICCPDLKKEMENGDFDKRNVPNPFKYYRSAILCHFKVKGEPWGVLSLDSPIVNAFRPQYRDFLCAFADTCGLAFVLAEYGNFGNQVYEQSQN